MLTIDVISDVICPWCFIGKRRQEKALGNRPASVRWHPFQLNPDMPREGIDRKTTGPGSSGAGSGRRNSTPRWPQPDEARGSRSTSTGRPAPRTRSTRTGSSGSPASGACRMRWSRPCSWPTSPTAATFPTGRRSPRSRQGPGSTEPRWTSLLAGDEGLDVVRAGEEQARRLGVSGVPFFVVNGQVALSGAQPPELFRQAFEQAGEAAVAGEAARSTR